MKWLKRLLTLAALILVGVIAFCLIGIYLYHGTPSWYRKRVATTQEVRDAANSADQKLIDLFSWAASAHAQQLRRIHGIVDPSDQPIGPKTVTFSEDELNSFLSTWKSPEKGQLQERIARYFTDARVIFQPDAVILAGESPKLDALVSAQFEPTIDPQGNTHLQLGSLSAGRLPIPRSAVASQLERLQILLQQQLAEEQPGASIDPALAANTQALAACWLRLLLSALNDSAADPVLIIPFDMSNLKHGMPVKLTAIKITDAHITLTMDPVSPDDRETIIQRLKQPIQTPHG